MIIVLIELHIVSIVEPITIEISDSFTIKSLGLVYTIYIKGIFWMVSSKNNLLTSIDLEIFTIHLWKGNSPILIKILIEIKFFATSSEIPKIPIKEISNSIDPYDWIKK